MALFTYSFCLAMLHSLWQSALLMLFYLAAGKTFLRNGTPLVKRNFLFAILLSQVFLFGLGFLTYYSGNALYDTDAGIGYSISALLKNNLLQAAAPWLFLAYSIVLFYKLLKAVHTWIHFRQQYKLGMQRPPVDLKLFTELKAYQFGIRRKVKIWLSHTIHTPVTFGFFKPVILLPVALVNNISTHQAETLIIHELTHIRTNDYLLNWFLLFTETVFFFNPFVTGFCSRIRMEREKNCDMGVIAFEYSPLLYAETLLQAEKMKQLVPEFQLAAVNRKTQLLDRIRFFSGQIDFRQPLRFNIVVPAIGLLLLLFFSAAILFQPVNAGTSDGLSAAPYLPLSTIEVPPVYQNESTVPASGMRARTHELEKAIASARKTKNTLQLPIGQPANETGALSEKQAEPAFVMPVAVTENDGSKQIIVQEESSGGASKSTSLKTYSLRFENGQWILEPVWTISAKEIPEDSLLKKFDSSTGRSRRIIPPQQ